MKTRRLPQYRTRAEVTKIYMTIFLDADPLRFLHGDQVPGAEDEPDTMRQFMRDLPTIWHLAQRDVLAEWINRRHRWGTRPLLFYRVHKLFYVIKNGRLQSQLTLLSHHNLLWGQELVRMRANKPMHADAYVEIEMPGWEDGAKFPAWNKPERTR